VKKGYIPYSFITVLTLRSTKGPLLSLVFIFKDDIGKSTKAQIASILNNKEIVIIGGGVKTRRKQG
jgi:hypothetical protein